MKINHKTAVTALVTSIALIAALWFLSSSHAGANPDRASSARHINAAKQSWFKGSPAANAKRATQKLDGNQTPDNIAGEPNVLDGRSALSAEIFTNVGAPLPGLFNDFTAPTLLANNDGREDFVADRAQQIATSGPAAVRTAVSEHTFANGFVENVYYFGDASGDFVIGTDTNPGTGNSAPAIDGYNTVYIPALINSGSSGGFTIAANVSGTIGSIPVGTCTSDTVAITGIAVDPVADLTDFGVSCGTIGEVVYVSILDSQGCNANAANQPIRTRILAFPFTDGGEGGVMPAGSALLIYSSPLSNSGIALDDDGSLYFHQADLQQFTGGAIFKATELPHNAPGASSCASGVRVNRTITNIPTVGLTSVTPLTNSNGVRVTNFSSATPNASGTMIGTLTPAFGNIVALATGPHNIVYAALARSFVTTDDAATQATEGQFSSPLPLGPTPSMVISFADNSGGKDSCTTGDPTTGTLRIADGYADVAQAGQTITPGVNNFRVFALGNGPDIRSASSAVGASSANTLKLDMHIDYSLYAGLMVDEEGTLYVISGGQPGGEGSNPSGNRGEILAFPDRVPYDRRADYIDLRGDVLPNPPVAGGNVGDGDSDRFDHIYWQAPLDSTTRTPVAVSGLSRGFLRYTNRLAPTAISPGVTLGTTQAVQADDDTSSAPIFFDALDPGHQVAGGDDQDTPFRGDDNDGVGNPPLLGALNGGFEFTFGGTGAGSVWNGFFLNSNGNITFTAGDISGAPTVATFRSGLPRIAPAWTNLNPSARSVDARVFPVQALGFAADNAFKIRWINVPQTGSEVCTASGSPGTGSNTFSLTLYDDGTGIDENANQPLNPANPIGNNAVPFDLQEGPTDLRFVKEPTTGVIVGSNPRRDGSGYFYNDYSRMDLIGSSALPVITGYSKGTLPVTNPPGLCETNVGEAARSADTTFGVIQGQTAGVNTGLIGEGTEPALYEFFNSGTNAAPEFDLRFEGNDFNANQVAIDKNRTSVGFVGLGANSPSNPIVSTILPDPFIPTPTTSGIINAIGPVTLNIVGSGFFPNEVTTVCPSGGESAARPGKTVTTSVVLNVDVDGNSIPEASLTLANVTVISSNLIRATIPLASGFPGSAFPVAASGGFGRLALTTTFSSGDNNVFGSFTRSATALVDLGTRAPVVTDVTASSGDCSAVQNLAISGGSFQFTQATSGGPVPKTVIDVIATEIGNPSNVIHASSFTVVDNTHLNATFNFGGASSKSFLIQAVGTGVGGVGFTSRDMVTLPIFHAVATPSGSGGEDLFTGPPVAPPPLGNEAGNLINFSCGGQQLQFSASQSGVVEDVIVAPVTITRTNPSGTVTVDFTTLEGTANQIGDYTTMSGTVTFGPGDTSKVVNIPITQDAYVEGNEFLQITLSNATGGAGVGALPTTLLFINDDDTVPSSANPIDTTSIFVNQQYHDFLSRQGDAAGVAFWTNGINSCVPSPFCTEVLRINTSAAFFLSIEFQETGFNVLRSQRVAFGHKSADPATRYKYLSFLKDAQKIGAGVIIGQPGDLALLEANKQAYATSIVNSGLFITAYPLALTASDYVDALFNTAGVLPTLAERNTAITAFGAGGTSGRVAAFRSVVDCTSVRNAETNPAFVLMEYYGYLRRNPTDPPDNNDTGYQFWLTKLNAFGGNFVNAEMVKAFLSSTEYRQRFGTP